MQKYFSALTLGRVISISTPVCEKDGTLSFVVVYKDKQRKVKKGKVKC